MACTISDKYGYRTANGTVTGVASHIVLAVPDRSTYIFDVGGTWTPNTTLNPNINGSLALRRGQTVTTDSAGDWSITLPYPAETEPATPDPKWSLLFSDGSVLTGVVPAVANPVDIHTLVATYGWTWDASIYVAPVTGGVLAEGIATFSGAGFTVSVMFATPFATNAYRITLGSSTDASTAEPMLVSYTNKTTTGFDLVAKDPTYVGTCDWSARL
jgi:hypothetical protein